MSIADLKTLQGPALVLLAVVLAGCAAVYYTSDVLQQAQRELARQEQALKEARNRLYQSGEEREIISRYLDRYLQLQRAGFIGEEQRINWLDGLRVANQRAELFGVDYQISEQRAYVHARDLEPGQLTLHQSVMKVKFGLLHEGDLMQFFGTLARSGAGVFHIDQCTVRRLEAASAIRYQPNLGAECDLSWITLRAPSGEKKS